MAEPGVVLEKFIQVLTGFDAEVLMPLLGPDPVLEFPYAPDPLPRRVASRVDCEQFWRRSQRMFREMTAHDIVVHPMAEPGLAMATWRSEAVTAGEPREYRNTYVSLARVENGLLDWYCEYFDPLVGLRAFGQL